MKAEPQHLEAPATAMEITTDLSMVIDGGSVPSTSGRWLEVRSPATAELVGRVPDGTEAASRPSRPPGLRSRTISAPFIVCADADIEAAARGATAGALINGGQDCTAATWAYVHRSVYDAFVARTAELFDSVRVGDPFDPSTDLGTLISQTQVARDEGFVQRAVAAGARVAAGGYRLEVPGHSDGAFYRPTLIVD